MTKLCITCSDRPRTTGRRYCRECYLERKCQQAKKRHAIQGRYTYDIICVACGRSHKACRNEQKFCSDCWQLRKELAAGDKTTNKYEWDSDYWRTNHQWAHRRIAEVTLNRKLTVHEVVHHMDGNPINNTLSNLLVLSRSAHGRLHVFLRDQRVILEKSGNENLENCWNTLKVPMTTTWLETANVKVKKLWEIGQSAAEPLSAAAYGDGSETMHQIPKQVTL